MIARVHKSMDKRDEGFTLIELLVVIIIIGILSAIAIPVFLNQRKKGVDASMKSDLRTVANEEETLFTDSQAYVRVNEAGTNLAVGPDIVKLSPGNTVGVELRGTSNTAYCVYAHNTSGSHSWFYWSDQGGLQPATTTGC